MDILVTVFAGAHEKHGGARRSAQLVELIGESHARAVNRPVSPGRAAVLAIRSPIAFLRACGLLLLRRPAGLSVRGMLAFVLYSAWFLALLKQHGPRTVYLEIGPSLGLVIGTIAAASRTRYVALPQNVEFLVPGQAQRLFRSQPAAFAAEVAVYRSAAAVVTISDFDAGVLECLSIPTHVLPYKPDRAHGLTIEAVRSAREASRKDHYLLLGTVRNPPTEIGMRRLLELIRQSSGSRRYVIAGFGSERLRDVAPPTVEVMGSVSDAELTDLLIRCHGLLLFQPQTSGYATRITEANLAGIPVYVMGGYRQAAHQEQYGVFLLRDIESIPDSAPAVMPLPSQASTPWLERNIHSMSADALSQDRARTSGVAVGDTSLMTNG